jgi:hypothetical protein
MFNFFGSLIYFLEHAVFPPKEFPEDLFRPGSGSRSGVGRKII